LPRPSKTNNANVSIAIYQIVVIEAGNSYNKSVSNPKSCGGEPGGKRRFKGA
jgi:hypothetical protein